MNDFEKKNFENKMRCFTSSSFKKSFYALNIQSSVKKVKIGELIDTFWILKVQTKIYSTNPWRKSLAELVVYLSCMNPFFAS